MKLIILCCLVFLTGCSKEPGPLNPTNLLDNPPDATDISLTLTQDNVQADGISYGEVVVKASDKLLKKYKEVNFGIAPIGKTSNGSSSIKLTLDVSGSARVFVVSETAGPSYITATIGTLNRTVVLTFLKNSADSLQLSIDQNNIPADNYSYAEIRAVTLNRPSGNNQLTFVADHGTFTNGSNSITVGASANGINRVYLKHNQEGLARVIATFNNFTKDTLVNFVPAFPDQLFIEPALSSLPATFDSKTTITSRLTRSLGTVTQGRAVTFKDSTTSGKSVGIFLNTSLSDPAGLAVTQYWLQDTSYHGLVYIKGTVINLVGKEVTGRNRILIQ